METSGNSLPGSGPPSYEVLFCSPKARVTTDRTAGMRVRPGPVRCRREPGRIGQSRPTVRVAVMMRVVATVR